MAVFAFYFSCIGMIVSSIWKRNWATCFYAELMNMTVIAGSFPFYFMSMAWFILFVVGTPFIAVNRQSSKEVTP
jgi:hypothetical protein